ncbi:MAG: hypothetical protein NUW02_00790 [Candidatus Campbellbacteria bacterium]|nr:hypothetical protein [Candidatus Campbellbacteria bacterium]
MNAGELKVLVGKCFGQFFLKIWTSVALVAIGTVILGIELFVRESGPNLFLFLIGVILIVWGLALSIRFTNKLRGLRRTLAEYEEAWRTRMWTGGNLGLVISSLVENRLVDMWQRGVFAEELVKTLGVGPYQVDALFEVPFTNGDIRDEEVDLQTGLGWLLHGKYLVPAEHGFGAFVWSDTKVYEKFFALPENRMRDDFDPNKEPELLDAVRDGRVSLPGGVKIT